MVNIGILGDVSVGKTSILRLFVRYLNKGDIENVDGGKKCTVVKADFSGESMIPEGGEKETKTIHPNRVVFRDDESGKAHTIFAPGGDRARSVVKMGIIAISRIATQVIAVFSFDKDLKSQFGFFDEVKFFPTEIYACLNKYDLKEDQSIDGMQKEIKEFFKSKDIGILDFFETCAETIENFAETEKYNNKVAEMILDVCKKHSAE